MGQAQIDGETKAGREGARWAYRRGQRERSPRSLDANEVEAAARDLAKQGGSGGDGLGGGDDRSCGALVLVQSEEWPDLEVAGGRNFEAATT